MNSREIFLAIERIAATPGKNDKEAIIKAHAVDPEFVRVLVYALDANRTFGIADVPERSRHRDSGQHFDASTWMLLDQLADRLITGKSARAYVEEQLNDLCAASAELLKRIITKDLRAGFTESTVNKAVAGLVPSFDCMLAHGFESKRVKHWPVAVEPKLDGVRVLCFVNRTAGTARFYSRNGKEFTSFDHLKPAVLKLPALPGGLNDSFVLDGEVVSGTFNATVSSVRKKKVAAVDAVFHVFDILPTACFYTDDKKGYEPAGTYAERLAILERVLTLEGVIRHVPVYLVTSEEQVHALYAQFQAGGLEGVIVKDLEGLYHRRRNHGWMKIKAEESVDVPVVGAFEGTGKYVGMLGGLIVDFNGVQVNVGGGISDQQREEFWSAYRADRNHSGSELLGRLIEVVYHEVTPDGSLRHPRFKRFRDDKQAPGLEQAGQREATL